MFTINTSEMRRGRVRFMRAFTREIDTAMLKAGEVAIKHVKTKSKFQRRSATNSLKDATQIKLVRSKSGRIIKVRSKKKTARILEHGSRPHVIRARRSRFLRFNMGGRVMYRRSVFHPGTKATNFLSNATKEAHSAAGPMLRAAMVRASRRF